MLPHEKYEIISIYFFNLNFYAWQNQYQLWHTRGLTGANELECVKYGRLTYLKDVYYKSIRELCMKT